jgi:hypothetical protein
MQKRKGSMTSPHKKKLDKHPLTNPHECKVNST